jgi:hypothetical protein
MRKLIAILTGLHVLAHGVFGCCDHGWAAMALPHAEQATSCACHHAHQHAHDAPGANLCDAVSQHLPAPAPHECAHASCHWMAGGGGPGIWSLEACGAMLMVAIVPIESSPLLAGHYRPSDDCARFPAPPLRLHLALGVIVV